MFVSMAVERNITFVISTPITGSGVCKPYGYTFVVGCLNNMLLDCLIILNVLLSIILTESTVILTGCPSICTVHVGNELYSFAFLIAENT